MEGLDYDDLEPGISEGEQAVGIKRILQIGLGVILVIAGIAMLVLPGQGILTIIIGLNLIKPDNPLVNWLREKTPGIPNEGPIPKNVVIGGVALFVGMTALSILFGPMVLDWVQDQI